MQEHWKRREELLDRLLDLPEDQRAAFLAEVARGNAEDAQALRDWLAGIERSTDFLLAATPDEAIGHDGEAVGNWRVLRLLGRGGMGEVWLGERADGLFAREVAIKFIRDDRPALMRSIESERRVLAGLRHPGIVHLLDAGTTPQGHPFLVTDYIEGLTLDAWLTHEQPGLFDRLDLFRQVAEAVAYAHAQLVVHRDIKPGNILVDSKGRTHLLDFGIASVLAQDMDSTATVQPALTPEFAAPELVSDNSASVRSDVYALGGLLHFLLCGQPPLRLRGLAHAEMLARIRDEPPPQFVARMAEPLRRQTSASMLADLEAIAQKALAKLPADRYGTVEAMLRDIDAAREHRPVGARPLGPLQRARRTLRRHRAAMALIALIILSLAAGLTGTIWQARLARQQRDQAQAQAARAEEEAKIAIATRDFLVGVFEAANPEQSRGNIPTALELLEAGTRQVETGLQEQPALQAELLGTLGDSYAGLGRYEQSRELLRKGLDTASAALGEDATATRKLLVRYARAVNASHGPYDDARARLQRMLAHPGPTPSTAQSRALTAMARAEYGGLLQKTGQLNAATLAIEQAANEARALGASGEAALINALHQRVVLDYSDGQRTDAIARLREIIALLQRQPGGEAIIRRNAARLDLATLLGEAGNGDEAEMILQEVVTSNATIYGTEHPTYMNSVVVLARAKLRHADPVQARILLEDVLASALRLFGEDSETTAMARANLGAVEYAQQNHAAAIAQLEKVRAYTVAHDGAHSPRALMMRQNLARLHADLGDYPRAETELRELLKQMQAIHSNDNAEALALLGDISRQRGDPTAARTLHQQALAVYAANGDESSFDVQDHRLALAEDERDLGNLKAARQHAQAGLDGLLQLDPVANAGMAGYARYLLAQIDTLEQRCSPTSRDAINAIGDRLTREIQDGASASSLAWKLARSELYLGLCRRQLDPTDAQASRLATDAARSLRKSPRTDPHTRRVAASVLGKAMHTPPSQNRP